MDATHLKVQFDRMVMKGCSLLEIQEAIEAPRAQLEEWFEHHSQQQESYRRRELSQRSQASFAMKFYRTSC